MGPRVSVVVPTFRGLDLLERCLHALRHQTLAREAVEVLRDVAAKLPTDPNVSVHLAQALAGSGQKQEAKELLRKVLSGSDPFAEREEAEKLMKTVGG